ncbi:hypothetical protein Metvu_1033 [Methanocaldococcus vulcanius M7]|uniref:Uncharacterized protein n=1 Tax=Methanocaldococcus vulcanius (strain ATCC 700851 / DSM 12094 / M7) TaxID=579137 RepID=C9RH39_METVM|nr:hypothetical protein [Methanocaldococcus vulcanius]ACX72891.1 hypothetical protein Metvu_1033 [Methanocaldococcus vulcanius M7]
MIPENWTFWGVNVKKGVALGIIIFLVIFTFGLIIHHTFGKDIL